LALARQGKVKEAVADLRQALALDPKNAEVRRNLDALLKPVDLRTWQQQGPKANGKWELAKDGTSVVQTINGAPTFFVNPDELLGTTVQGKFRVEGGDDDYIGFVFGYQAPLGEVKTGAVACDFFLFAWKSANQGRAVEGFTLTRVRGNVVIYDSDTSPWWTLDNPEFKVLAKDQGKGKGWKPKTDYLFDLVYERDHIQIAVDGKTIFDLPNARGDNPAGRFGFYNYSQAGVRYSGFTIGPAASAPAATLKVVYESKDKAALPAKLLPAVELILDCSFSMKEPVGGTPKIDVARRVLRDLADSLPADVQVGLRLYGHFGFWHREKDPKPPYPPSNNDPRLNTDSDLAVQIRPLEAAHRKHLFAWLDWADARGKTPLCYSLLEAKKDFPTACATKTVVLLSDGMETCGGSLDDVAKAYAGSDVGVVIQVVGFDIRDLKVRQQLEKIAKVGGGNYYDARDAKQLVEALRKAVPSTGFEVLAADGDAVLASGSINGKPRELPAGSYRVRLAGSKAKPTAVRCVSGQLVQLSLDESGDLVVAGK
jgi:hypothetical protein